MQIISIIVGEPIIMERLTYVLDFLENHPLSPKGVKFDIQNESGGEAIEIFYGGGNSDKRFFIPRENKFFNTALILDIQWPCSLPQTLILTVSVQSHAHKGRSPDTHDS